MKSADFLCLYNGCKLFEQTVEEYTEFFKTPQAFIDIGGKMLVVPVDEENYISSEYFYCIGA